MILSSFLLPYCLHHLLTFQFFLSSGVSSLNPLYITIFIFYKPISNEFDNHPICYPNTYKYNHPICYPNTHKYLALALPSPPSSSIFPGIDRANLLQYVSIILYLFPYFFPLKLICVFLMALSLKVIF